MNSRAPDYVVQAGYAYFKTVCTTWVWVQFWGSWIFVWTHAGCEFDRRTYRWQECGIVLCDVIKE